MNKPFTLYHSGRLGVPNNCLYPHSVDVVDEASMKKAVSYDYVAALSLSAFKARAFEGCVKLCCAAGKIRHLSTIGPVCLVELAGLCLKPIAGLTPVINKMGKAHPGQRLPKHIRRYPFRGIF